VLLYVQSVHKDYYSEGRPPQLPHTELLNSVLLRYTSLFCFVKLSQFSIIAAMLPVSLVSPLGSAPLDPLDPEDAAPQENRA